jgi:hypothetical protein
MKILDPLPNERILSLLLTLQCTAECNHCGTSSSPRVKSRLPVDKALIAINQASKNHYKLVVFTGGEPLLYGPDLLKLISHASSLDLRTRVVTNAFWAKNNDAASATAQKLRDAGLREINFSTGDEHVKFVPVDNILFAARACLDLKLPVSVMIEVVSNNSVTKEALLTHPLFDKLFGELDGELINFCESPWMPLDEFRILDYPEGYYVNRETVGARVGCDSIVNTTTVLADGKIMACCGLGTQSIPELHVGHVDDDDLKTIDERIGNDFLKKWIKIEGPEKILAWAAGKDPSIIWENMYAHRCQACKRLYSDPKVRQVIANFHEEKIVDVICEEWLLFHYRPNV